jgi:hypothetical protein
VLETVHAQELAQECVQFGLEPPRDHEDSPRKGKCRYVARRLRRRELPELLELAAKVQVVYESAELAHLLSMIGGDGQTLLSLRRWRLLRLAGTDGLVDHLPDLLVQPVLLPDAVRGP